MKLRNIAFTSILVALASILGGCVADDTTAHQKTTAFGLYTSEPASYKLSRPASTVVRTDDATGMEVPSGNRTTFLWGMFTFEDY